MFYIIIFQRRHCVRLKKHPKKATLNETVPKAPWAPNAVRIKQLSKQQREKSKFNLNNMFSSQIHCSS